MDGLLGFSFGFAYVFSFFCCFWSCFNYVSGVYHGFSKMLKVFLGVGFFSLGFPKYLTFFLSLFGL